MGKLKAKRKISVSDIVIMAVMVVICFVTLYPVWYTVVLSFNDATDALRGGIYWWPREFSLASYKAVFQDKAILNAYAITIARTVIGTLSSVFFTAMVAYAFSKSHIMGNKFYLGLGTVTMFFSGGLIPYFIWMRQLGLYNNFLMYIIPSLFSFYNAIIFMTFFREMPASLEESAKLDGCTRFRTLTRIILPLAKTPMISVTLFQSMWTWNDFLNPLIYIDSAKNYPVALGLRLAIDADTAVNWSKIISMTVVSMLPLIIMFLLLQRYFVAGIATTGLKG